MVVTLPEKRRHLLDNLASIPDAHRRLAYLVELGRHQPPLDVAFRSDKFKVEGCLSNLWFVPEFRNESCYFRADSDSAIVKGVAGLLCDFYSGHTPEEILSLDPSFLGDMGIKQHLTPNRRNGLSRLWEKIRTFATEHASPPVK